MSPFVTYPNDTYTSSFLVVATLNYEIFQTRAGVRNSMPEFNTNFYSSNSHTGNSDTDVQPMESTGRNLHCALKQLLSLPTPDTRYMQCSEVHSLLPVGREFLGSLVVSSQSVHSALDENESKLGVLVLTVALQMLAHRHRLLDQMVQIFRDLRAQSCEGGDVHTHLSVRGKA